MTEADVPESAEAAPPLVDRPRRLAAEPAVHWHEGMFLRPHHFQRHERYVDARLASTLSHSGPHRWGVAELDIDEEALKAHTLVVRSARVVTRLGREIAIPGPARIEPESFLEAFEATTEPLAVWLAVSIPREGVPQLANGEHPNRPYVVSEPREVDDENVRDSRAALRFRVQNVRVFVQKRGEAPPSAEAWDAVKVAEIERRSTIDPEPILSGGYIPPLLCVEAWPTLRQRLSEVDSALRAKNERVARDVVARGVAGRAGADVHEKLTVTNELVATFGQCCLVPGVHPLGAYVELCRLVGRLSAFDQARPACRPLALYDHTSLARCFGRAIDEAKALIEFVYRTSYEQSTFGPLASAADDAVPMLEASYDKAWLDRFGWTLYLGIDVAADADQPSYEQVVEFVRSSTKLVARRTAEERDALALYGIGLDSVLQNPPPGLPPLERTHFMLLADDERWRELQADQFMRLVWVGPPDPRYTFHLFAVRKT